LDAARNRLDVKRGSLLLAAKWDSPFVCDPQIEREMESLTRLCVLATPETFQRFVQCYKEAPRKLFAGLDPTEKARLARLSAVKTDLEAEARRHLARIAHPGTDFWRAEFDKFIAPYDADLKAAVACFQKRIAEAHHARRQLESLHDETLERGFESKLVPAVATIAELVDIARRTMAEVRGAWQREGEAAGAIRAVWQGAQRRKQTLFRQPKCLGEADLALVAQWGAGRRTEGYWMRAMEAARGAELIALDIYRELRGNAEDLSVQQILQPGDSRWRLADIKASTDLIDVKNAMRSFSSRRRYSEHHVRRLKQDDSRRNVVISGFLSPYPQEGHPGHGPDEDQMVCWLGETSLGAIEQMKREFESDRLQLDLPTTRTTLVPPWLFDYPGQVYSERDDALARVCAAAFAFPRIACPVGAVVMAGRVPPPQGNDQLAEEAYALSQRRCKLGYVSRPVLYLHVLDRFCRSLVAATPFPAGVLRDIIFPPDSGALRGVADASIPLGVLDPVEIVSELVDVLAKVSTHCSLSGHGFTRFKLTGKNLLRGCRRNGTWQTLLAYCGGWKKLNGGREVKCGRNPLFIGQSEVCLAEGCGYLICDRCGHCRAECPNCAKRQERWTAPGVSSLYQMHAEPGAAPDPAG
jgi:hypothetical protein